MEHDVTFLGKRYKISLSEPDSDYIQSTIAETGKPHEADLIAYVVKFADPRKTFVDVGAHIGNHSLAVHAVLGCDVLAIEPNKTHVNTFRRSIRLNQWSKKIRVIHGAAGLLEGSGPREVFDERNLGSARLGIGNGEITIHTLDKLLHNASVGVLKIDVEGMEFEVLSGAEQTILRDHPLICVEVKSERKFWSVYSWLVERGYLWGATFGRTSTHFFRPGEVLVNKADFSAQISREYKLVGAFDKPNKKSRDLSSSVERVREVARVAEERVREDLVRREAELVAIGEVRDELRVRLEELTVELKMVRSELEVASRAREGLEAELAELRRKNSITATELAAVEVKYQTVRASKAFALGKLLEESLRSPRGRMVLLPRLWAEFVRPKFFPKRGPTVTVPLTAIHSPLRDFAGDIGRSTGDIPFAPILATKALGDVVVLGIADPFTDAGLQKEVSFHQALPDNIEKQLDEVKPDLLFVESAWDGEGGAWNRQISTPSSALKSLVAHSRARGIPTLFWNKEDPVHFSTFLAAASLFDYVFTTDIDMVPKYVSLLGHDRVNWLPFAVQPHTYNPVNAGERKDAVIFAGAYYTRYPERAKEIEDFLDVLPLKKKVDIYDRNLHTDDDRYRFPDRLRKHIVGTLKQDEVATTTKSYRYALNMNSIKQSQTMFARRVVECLASGNIVLSNYSRSLTTLLGDLVLSADNGKTLAASFASADDAVSASLRQVHGMRVAVSRFSYRSQLKRMLSLISGGKSVSEDPTVHVVARVTSQADAHAVLDSFNSQIWPNKTLTIACSKSLTIKLDKGREGQIVVVDLDVVDRKGIPFPTGEADWISLMSAKNSYGPHYLSDLLLWSQFGAFSGVGKKNNLSYGAGGVTIPEDLANFTTTSSLPSDSSIFAVSELPDPVTIGDLVKTMERETALGNFLAADSLSFIRNCNAVSLDDEEKVVHQTLRATAVELDGVDFSTAQTSHRVAQVVATDSDTKLSLKPGGLFSLFFPKHKRVQESSGPDGLDGATHSIPHRKVKISVERNRLVMTSSLGDGEHEYLYALGSIAVADLPTSGSGPGAGEISVHLSLVGDCSVSGVARFLDHSGNPISTTVFSSNRNESLAIPRAAHAIVWGIRYQGPGEARIEALSFSHEAKPVPKIVGQGKVLIVSGAYPAYDNLYRHAFIHTRNKAYRQHGVDTDVFRVSNKAFAFSEFEGLPVIDGSLDDLAKVVASGAYSHIAVHLMTPEMWQVLQHVVEGIAVTVWLHGAEIEPYWRRPEIDPTPERIETSDKRVAFWKKLFAAFPDNLHLVFVSHTFAKQVFDDYEVVLDESRFSVIPNPIDTDLFSYEPKDPAQRYKVLSIRPYASSKYANDLSVAAVLELSKTEDFNKFEFLFVGDGVLWDSTVAPLKKFKNVSLKQGFLTQPEIAELHKAYGVFLCPTRHDTQGVSRDEAMASGLVPISTRVGAVEEFVPSNAGVLVSLDDHVSLATALGDLANILHRFQEMSRGASEQVGQTRSVHTIVEAEKRLMGIGRTTPDG